MVHEVDMSYAGTGLLAVREHALANYNAWIVRQFVRYFQDGGDKTGKAVLDFGAGIGTLSVLKLDRGLMLGGLLVAGGLFLLFRALSFWAEVNFGLLSPEKVTRVVIGSSLSISLGLQIVFASLLVGMMKIHPVIRPVAWSGGEGSLSRE